MTKTSAGWSGIGKMSEFFTERSSVKSKKFVEDCVNSTPDGNMAYVANEPSLDFFGSIAQSKKGIVQQPSSTQLPNSHSNLKTNGQVETNINLPVHEPQEPSSRTNVINNAHVANNIMQEQRQLQYAPPSPPMNWYANSSKRSKHSPTTVSSNNALRWFTVRSLIPSQVEHAGTVEFSQPSAFTTFKGTR